MITHSSPPLTRSMMFKITAAVLLVEILTLALAGAFYINRFSQQVDLRLKERLSVPGSLMANNLLYYNTLADQEAMKKLVGEDLEDGLLFSPQNGTIFESLKPEYRGTSITNITWMNPAWVQKGITNSQLFRLPAGTNTFLVTITPISVVDGRTPYLLAVMKLRTNSAEAEKLFLFRIFVVGSLLCILATTALLVFAFKRGVASRIESLLAVLGRVERGDLAARAEVNGSLDEIGVIQSGVNAMVSSLDTKIRELREAEEKYRAIVENAAEGIMQSTCDGRILNANPALAIMLGFKSPAELIHSVSGLGTSIYADPHDREKVLRLLETHGSLTGVEVQWKRVNETWIWVSISARAVVGSDGKLSHYDSLIHDVTARHLADQLRRELPKRILEAQEGERGRVSRELHDGVNQILSSIGFRIRAIQDLMHSISPAAASDLGHTKELLDKSISEVRRISRNLRPGELDDLGLLPAIRAGCEDFTLTTKIRVNADLPNQFRRLTPEVELHFYRIFQEALTNVHKHAMANAVTLNIFQTPDSTTMVIRDNGCGISAGKKNPNGGKPGIGLLNMQERAAFHQGTCEILPAPNAGTEVRVIMPG